MKVLKLTTLLLVFFTIALTPETWACATCGCSAKKEVKKACPADCKKACCAKKKACPADCKKACCVKKKGCASGCKSCSVKKKSCPADCKKACCAKKKACPADCKKACCTAKKKACPADCKKACCTAKKDKKEPTCEKCSTALEAGEWLDNYETAKKISKETKRPILIDFSGSDWCGWCIRLDKEVFTQKEFKEYAAKNLVLYLADFPRNKKQEEKLKDTNKKLMEKYGVRGFPTIIITDAEGKELAKTGYKRGGAEKYIEHLKELLKK